MDNDLAHVTTTEPAQREQKVTLKRMLCFQLSNASYCIELGYIKEVIKPQNLTRVPCMPVFIKGVMNLRGEIITIFDIGHFIGSTAEPLRKHSRVIVTDVVSHKVGFIADRVLGKININSNTIQPPLSILDKNTIRCITGQIEEGNEIYLVLNIYNILTNSDITNLTNN